MKGYKFAWSIGMQKEDPARHFVSSWLGMFATKEYGVKKAKETFGFKSGHYDTVTAYRRRVPLREWQELVTREKEGTL